MFRVMTVFVAASILLAGSWASAQAAKEEDGFKSLFNGKDLKGWDGDPTLWSVKDGAIVGQTTAEAPLKNNNFLICRDAKVADFVLKVKFKILSGNSGIQYRSHELPDVKWGMGGYQADFVPDNVYTGIVYEEKGRGILVKQGEQAVIGADGKIEIKTVADAEALKKEVRLQDWNEYEITAVGNHVVQKINGKVMSEFTDNQVDKRAMDGLIALQVHAGPPMHVEFKDIRVKTLPAAAK